MKKEFVCGFCTETISDGSKFCPQCGSSLSDGDTQSIQTTNPGILELPEGAFNDWSVEKLVGHCISLAKKKGCAAISKAIANLERWNKNDDPTISKKARAVLDALAKSEEWNNLKK